MVASGGSLSSAAAQVRQAVAAIHTEEATLRSTLGQAASALGWEGQITDRGQEASSEVDSAVRELADALDAGAGAIADFGEALDTHGPPLRELKAEYEDASRMSFQDAFIIGLTGPMVGVQQEERRQERLTHLRNQAAPLISALRDADRACERSLHQAAAALDALSPPGISKNFTRSLAPAGSWGIFQEQGLVDTAAEEGIAARFQEGMTATELRELLGEVELDRLAGFLQRHPHLIALLAGDFDQRHDDDPAISGLWDAIGEFPNGQVADPSAIARIAAYWDGLSADDRYRLHLLYPTLIGNLDGIDLQYRAAANLAVVRSAQSLEHARIAQLEALPDNQTVLEQQLQDSPWWIPDWVNRLVHGQMEGGFIYDFRMRDQELARAQNRLQFYDELMERQPDLRGGPALDGERVVLDADQRALLVFDPRGDGLFAEWHGEFDAAHVGVFVPGTTTDMANIGRYNELMRDLAGEPDVAGVTWMGVDLPNAVGADATRTRYSAEGGEALLRFAEGLGTRLDADQSLTAIGHSAGGGIVNYADAIGMNIDRTITIAPSGSALGIEGQTPDAYPGTDWAGVARNVQRFTQTAPGDPIWVAQNQDSIPFVPDGLGHGTNPNGSDQITRLETGRDAGGARVEGHSDVLNPDTDAWNNVIGVVTGGDVIPFRTEWVPIIPGRPFVRRRNVYADDTYTGTDPVPIDQL